MNELRDKLENLMEDRTDEMDELTNEMHEFVFRE